MRVPSNTRTVVLHCNIEKQTEMNKPELPGQTFNYPAVLALGAGIMEGMQSPYRKWLWALFSGDCRYLTVRKLI